MANWWDDPEYKRKKEQDYNDFVNQTFSSSNSASPYDSLDMNDPVIAHAYADYPDEASYAQMHDQLLKRHFAGQNAGHGHRGGTMPWRANESQRRAYKASRPNHFDANASLNNINSAHNRQFGMYNKASQFLQHEKSRVANLPYQPYQGPLTTGKSPLSLRAEQLADKYSQKLPYQRQMDELIGRAPNIEGLTNENKNSIKGFEDAHRGINKNKSSDFLSRFLRNNYDDADRNRLEARTNKQLGKKDAVNQEELNKFSEALALDQKMSNSEKINVLRQLSSMRLEDKNKLLGALTAGGNQQNAIANMGLEAKQKNFQNELAQPYRESQLLEQELAPHQKYSEQVKADAMARHNHALRRKEYLDTNGTDIGEYQSQLSNVQAPTTSIDQILRAYGVTNTGDSAENMRRSNISPFPSAKVADTPAELQAADNDLMNLNVKKSDQLKSAVGSMVGDSNAGDRITGSALENIRERTALEDKTARKGMKSRIRQISSMFANRGEYNSPAHIRAIEEETARSNASQSDNRQKGVMSSLNNRFELNQHQDKYNKQHAQYMAMLEQLANDQKIQGTMNKHKKGVNQFNVAQDVADKDYLNRVSAHDFNWPTLRNSIAGQGFNVNKLNRQNYIAV